METLMIAELAEQSATETQALTHSQVRLFLRQRFPFLMIDQVLSIELGERVVGIKNVSGNEPHFIGHFPDQPIMPGVLIIESMAQTASFLGWREGIGGQSAPMQYLASANVSFHQLVMPGDQLVNEIREKRKVGNLQIVSAISRVGEKVVARGELVLATGVSA